MSYNDWLVLCALMTEHEHGFRHALHFVKRTVNEDPKTVLAFREWIETHLRQFHHEMIEDGFITYRRNA